MATITPTVARSGDDKVLTITYTPMANGDTGVPIHDRHARYSDRQVTVFGTFGTGGNAKIQGTPDQGTTYATLTDPQGNALDITTAKVEQILEGLPVMRPNISAGDGTTALSVVFTCRKP